MIDSILIPTDFSPASWQATKFGMDLARSYQSTLSLLHVLPTVSRFSSHQNHHQLPEKMEEIKAKMDELSQGMANGYELKIRNYVVPGNVAKTMLDFVNNHSYDMVILGINSDGASNNLGSHTSEMIEQCRVPVLVVPNQQVPHPFSVFTKESGY